MTQNPMLTLTKWIMLLLLSFVSFNFCNANFNDLLTCQAKDVLNLSLHKCNSIFSIQKVVIDPGHGGKDGGCSGNHSSEKHIALDISLAIRDAMKAQYPNVEIIMTRESDVFVPLHKRAQIANDAKADLFVSVHCNAYSGSKKVQGTETYVLGTDAMQDNLEVVKRENSAVFFEKNHVEIYGLDANSDIGHIANSTIQYLHLEQSVFFAQYLNYNMSIRTPFESRGVKQAKFIVLKNTIMPAVLLETAYLTDPKDEKLLNSKKVQHNIANAFVESFAEYKSKIEGKNISLTTPKTKTTEKKKPRVIQTSDLTNEKKLPSFRIQVAASKLPLKQNHSKWKFAAFYGVKVIQENGMYKYRTKDFYDFGEAQRVKKILENEGFRGAWLLAFRGDKRLKTDEAKKIISLQGKILQP